RVECVYGRRCVAPACKQPPRTSAAVPLAREDFAAQFVARQRQQRVDSLQTLARRVNRFVNVAGVIAEVVKSKINLLARYALDRGGNGLILFKGEAHHHSQVRHPKRRHRFYGCRRRLTCSWASERAKLALTEATSSAESFSRSRA